MSDLTPAEPQHPVPAAVLSSEIRVTGPAGPERLYIEGDGWWLVQGDGPPRAITVSEAVSRARTRAQVFRPTREYIAWNGQQLADAAWIDPLADTSARRGGVDPKIPAENIAEAGRIIQKLGEELAAAEAEPQS